MKAILHFTPHYVFASEEQQSVLEKTFRIECENLAQAKALKPVLFPKISRFHIWIEVDGKNVFEYEQYT